MSVAGSLLGKPNLWQVKPLGCAGDGRGPELAAEPRAIAEVKEHLVGHGPFVGIAPGAAFGPSKRWPAQLNP